MNFAFLDVSFAYIQINTKLIFHTFHACWGHQYSKPTLQLVSLIFDKPRKIQSCNQIVNLRIK